MRKTLVCFVLNGSCWFPFLRTRTFDWYMFYPYSLIFARHRSYQVGNLNHISQDCHFGPISLWNLITEPNHIEVTSDSLKENSMPICQGQIGLSKRVRKFPTGLWTKYFQMHTSVDSLTHRKEELQSNQIPTKATK